MHIRYPCPSFAHNSFWGTAFLLKRGVTGVALQVWKKQSIWCPHGQGNRENLDNLDPTEMLGGCLSVMVGPFL